MFNETPAFIKPPLERKNLENFDKDGCINDNRKRAFSVLITRIGLNSFLDIDWIVNQMIEWTIIKFIPSSINGDDNELALSF